MSSYKLSIVTPVFNKWNFTKACLNDLSKLPLDHQIIIVDNASSDETKEELSKIECSNFKYIRNDENLGFAKACNIGFSHSDSDNILFLNNDIRVKSEHDTWTDALLSVIEDNVLVGPTGGFVDPDKDFNFVYETSNENKKINYMSGWCLCSSKINWKKLDISGNNEIFSEEFFVYFEDTDLSFRAREIGFNKKIINIPVVHFGKQSSNQLNVHKLYFDAKKIFLNKWKNRIKKIEKIYF